MIVPLYRETELMTDDKNWKPCPAGTIKAVAEQQSQSDATDSMTRRAAFGMVAAAGVGLGYAMWARVGTVATLTCGQTKALAERFVLGQLTPGESSAVKAHCDHCRPCADYIERLKTQSV